MYAYIVYDIYSILYKKIDLHKSFDINCEMNCENCGIPHKYLFYKQNEAGRVIIKVCNNMIPHHNNDIINKILKYIDWYRFYTVNTEFKERIPFPVATGDPEIDADLEQRIDDWHCDGGSRYTSKNIQLCRRCYIASLLCCYKMNNCLPHLRTHFNYFMISRTNILIDEEEIREASRKSVLPISYICSYYRNQVPINIDDNKLIIIKSFK